MRLGSILITVIGLGSAGASVYFAQQFLDTENASASQVESQVVRVMAAAQDIPFGKQIESQMLTTIDWPKESVPKGVFTNIADILPIGKGPPRRAKRAIAQGELLFVSRLSEYGEKVTIVQTLGENTRAMAIKVSAETAVGGFVTPSDYVDVVLTQGKGVGLRTVTILQNLRVIGVDQRSDEQNDLPGVARTVTVEVTPVQGQKLALAQRAGVLSLSLRSLDNAIDAPLDSIRLTDLLLDKSPVPEQEKRAVVRLRRGTANVVEVEIN
jgi:pilus assembly protein CpaB